MKPPLHSHPLPLAVLPGNAELLLQGLGVLCGRHPARRQCIRVLPSSDPALFYRLRLLGIGHDLSDHGPGRVGVVAHERTAAQARHAARCDQILAYMHQGSDPQTWHARGNGQGCIGHLSAAAIVAKHQLDRVAGRVRQH